MEKENVRNCWLVAIVTILAIVGLITGHVFYTYRLSSVDATQKMLHEKVNELDELVKERTSQLDKLVEEKVKRLDETRKREDEHNREIMEIRLNQKSNKACMDFIEIL